MVLRISLLACRQAGGLHLFAAQDRVVFGSGRHAGGSPAAWDGDAHREKPDSPDLVVKFQLIDIVAVILWLVLRLHFVYQRQIEG
jgi:hypothetical protein